LPSYQAIASHAELLARYAAICQVADIVPIVEPEVLLDGDYSIDHSAKVSRWVLSEVFAALYRHNVALDALILKPSMVLSGKNAEKRAGVREVAEKTLEVFADFVPASVPTINFLSGGQTPEEATAHLQMINELKGSLPWNISFSYSRALQEPPLHAWKGQDKNWSLAQDLFLKRAKLNSQANLGKYSESMERSS
jgi:fructose-bisphosphate aldolase class I